MYVRHALASASIDLLADYCVAETAPSVIHCGQNATADPTTGYTKEDAQEAALMAALEAEWEHEWAAEGAKLKLFYLMREALAPLIEAVLLVDRAIYLTERINAATRKPSPGLEREGDADDGGRQKVPESIVRLFPLFDPALSPRNICLFASAPEMSTGPHVFD